jgi:signal transduction histidine kinase
LEREPNLSDIGLEMTGFILSETQRLNDLITTLLACAKPRPPHFANHDINDIIAHTLDLLQNQADTRNIQLSTRLDASPSMLDCDRDHLIQVLLNLVMNAIQHVSDGGQVEVYTANSGESLEICVNDDGIGIRDDDKSKVFEPFFTQRQDGVGLGLTVVQQIVQAHQGIVYVANSRLGGASFHVVLPTVQKES